MKSFAQLAALLALCLPLTGCTGDFLPEEEEITNVELMRTLAVDEGERDGTISVTAAGGIRPGDQTSDPQPPVLLSWEAPTVFSACVTMQTLGNGYVSYGHVGECVLGADASKQTVRQLLDYVVRDFEMRVDTELYVSVQQNAGELLRAVANKTKAPTDRLQSLTRELPLQSSAWSVKIRDFVIDLSENGCALAPAIRVIQNEKEKTVACNQMCYFANEHFAGTLSPELSRAAAILSGKAKSGVAVVTLSDGSTAGLRITDIQHSWKPHWDHQQLTSADLSVHVQTDLAELNGNPNLFQPQVQQDINQQLSRQLQKQIQDLLAFSQQNHTDFLHLGRTLRMYSPARRNLVKQCWEEWFPNMNFNVQVDCTVERSYEINRAEEKQ